MFDIQSIKDTIAELNLAEKIAKIKDLKSQSVEICRQINEVTETLTWQELLNEGLRMEAIVRHCKIKKEFIPEWKLKNSQEFIDSQLK